MRIILLLLLISCNRSQDCDTALPANWELDCTCGYYKVIERNDCCSDSKYLFKDADGTVTLETWRCYPPTFRDSCAAKKLFFKYAQQWHSQINYPLAAFTLQADSIKPARLESIMTPYPQSPYASRASVKEDTAISSTFPQKKKFQSR